MTQQKVVSRLKYDGGSAPSQLIGATSVPMCILVTEITRTPKGSSDGTGDDHDRRHRGPRHQVQIVGSGNTSSALELVRLTAWQFSQEISCVACDSTLSVFATGSRSGHIQIFDSKLRHPVLQWRQSTLTRGSNSSERGNPAYADAAMAIQALAFSPDGTSILSISAPDDRRVVTEWACSDEAIANAGEVASTDSSDDGFRDADTSRAPLSAPQVICNYSLEDDDIALPDDDESKAPRFELKFHPSGHQFIVATHWKSRLVGVQVYKVSLCGVM